MEKRDPLKDVANTSSNNEQEEAVDDAPKQPDSAAGSSDNKENGFSRKVQNPDADKDVGCGSSKLKEVKPRRSVLKLFDPLYKDSPEKVQATSSSKSDQRSRPQLVIEDSDETDSQHSPRSGEVSDDENTFVDACAAPEATDEASSGNQPSNPELEDSFLRFYTPEKASIVPRNSDSELASTSQLTENKAVLTSTDLPTSSTRDQGTISQIPDITESDIVSAISKKLNSECGIIPTRSRFTLAETEHDNYNILRGRFCVESRDAVFRACQRENAVDANETNSLTSVNEIRNISPERSNLTLQSGSGRNVEPVLVEEEEEQSDNRASASAETAEKEESSDDSQGSKVTVIEKRSDSDIAEKEDKPEYCKVHQPRAEKPLVSTSTETGSPGSFPSTAEKSTGSTEEKATGSPASLKSSEGNITEENESGSQESSKSSQENLAEEEEDVSFIEKPTFAEEKETVSSKGTGSPESPKSSEENITEDKDLRITEQSKFTEENIAEVESSESPKFFTEDSDKPIEKEESFNETNELQPEEIIRHCQVVLENLPDSEIEKQTHTEKFKQSEEQENLDLEPEREIVTERVTELAEKQKSCQEEPEPQVEEGKEALVTESQAESDPESKQEDKKSKKKKSKEDTCKEPQKHFGSDNDSDFDPDQKSKGPQEPLGSDRETNLESEQKPGDSQERQESDNKQQPESEKAQQYLESTLEVGSETDQKSEIRQEPDTAEEIIPEIKTEEPESTTSVAVTKSEATACIHQDEEHHLDSGVDSIEESYTKSPKSQVGDSEDSEKGEDQEISPEKEGTLTDGNLIHTNDEPKTQSVSPATSDEESKIVAENSAQEEQPQLLDEPAKPRVEGESHLISEPAEPETTRTTINLTDNQKSDIKTAVDFDSFKAKMADLSEKLSEQQQENSDLKLQLNAIQQAKASLELEIRQKEEVIIKTQAEALKNEQTYKQEIKQLREKLKENSKLIEKDGSKELEDQLKEAKAREAKAVAELNQRTKDDLNYQKIMEEYENTIATRFADYQKLKEEHETATRHLANIELAFSDVHQKYERTKALLEGFKSNEEALNAALQASEKTCKQHEERYESLKAHAKGQIEKSNKEILMLRDKYEMDINKLKAIIKRLEIKCSSLEVSLQQKTEECAALSALCDEVTGKKV